ncbi:MAG: hypothetical protein KDC79_01070 [Cyclobacteriaceae bacterium]|nr:hypothetical protein [Cyclobacteriaceae bacterium]
MNNINKVLVRTAFLMAVAGLLLVANGCKKDDGPTQTQGDKILEAIVGTWSFGTSGIPNEAAALISNPSITVTTSGSTATFISDSSSGLNAFITGGIFTVNPDGSITSVAVNSASDSGLSISDPTVTASENELKISFSATATGGRMNGIGTWTIDISLN